MTPNRTAFIALIQYERRAKQAYILAPTAYRLSATR